MGLCGKVNPFDGCDESSDDFFISPQSGNPCDCTKIIGRDHLKMKRARKFRCKSKRISLLALPRYLTKKHCVEEPESAKTTIEIIRPNEEQTPVRIQWLAYPKVRKLVSSREEYKQIVDREWFGRFDTLIKRSMLTMYSRLSNVQLPSKCERRKWTSADWKRHCEWLKKNALPRPIQKPLPINRERIPLEQLTPSIQKLANPRYPRSKYRQHCGYVSTVKDAAQIYQPTDRIMSLAIPKQRDIEEETKELTTFGVSPAALMYKPSKFLWKLSVF